MSVAATVAGMPVEVSEVEARESLLRNAVQVTALPRPGTSEGRQLRRWLTQLLVTERVVALEASARGVSAAWAPSEESLLPHMTARLEIGSIAAAALKDPLARALFVHVTRDVVVDDQAVADYHVRNPRRFADLVATGGWRVAAPVPDLTEVGERIRAHLLGAARRRAFRTWLDQRRAALVWLAPGYEHPGDPRQPDNTHRH